jgi:type II secretory pathway pseudopilin PulG
MKQVKKHEFLHKLSVNESGMTLLDVLLAIVIFAVGMLALAQLQTNLTRSSADASFRTMATNIGEEIFEGLRSFQLVYSDTSEDPLFAFADIDSDYVTGTVTRGGINYDVFGTVKGYNLELIEDSTDENFGKTLPIEFNPAVVGTVYDYKQVELTITWSAGPSFQVDEDTTVDQGEGGMGTGQIVMTAVVPSIPALASSKVNADQMITGGPKANYAPGQRPDIVPIEIDNQKFKESLRPEPLRRKDLRETWFDVVTYSQKRDDEGNLLSTFLRREEFVVVECDCVLYGSAGVGGDGFGPAIWTGAEYKIEQDMFEKEFGTQDPNSPAQSLYCDTCCRDHHDSDDLVNQFKPDYNGGGNHPHYLRLSDGSLLEPAAVPLAGGPIKDANRYTEACRLVRKDGFFRVAQDLELYENNAFPADYLDDDSEIGEYSDYVKSVAAYNLEGGGFPGAADSQLTYAGRDALNRSLVTSNGQQLRSRGIYVDRMNTELSDNLKNCFGNGDRSECKAPFASTVYELYPFFDIQVTRFADWSTTPLPPPDGDGPISITNDPLPTKTQEDDGFSRGLAGQVGSGIGPSTGHSKIETGNIGLVGTPPITDDPQPNYDTSDIYLTAGEEQIPEGTTASAAVPGDASVE